FGDLFVIFNREDHRDIDVDPGGDAFANGRKSFGRGGNIYHHIRSVEHGPQAFWFGGGGFGCARPERGGFQTDITVQPVGAFVNRFEQIGRPLDVVDNQRFINLVDALTLGDLTAHRVVVIGAAGDGLFKDGGV